MKATIDLAGRVVIPKALRDRAGLKPGTEVEIEFDRDHEGVLITIPLARGRLVREGGLLVWEPPPGTPPLTQEQIRDTIRKLREDRKNF